MRATLTQLAAAALAIAAICVCFAAPALAEDTTPAPTVTVDTVSQPPSDLASEMPTSSAEPRGQRDGRLVLVPAFNMFYPSDSKTQERFGDSWPSIGLSVAWRERGLDPKKIELRLDGMGCSGDKVKALVFPLGMGVSQRLSSSDNFVTYAGVSANLYISKVVSELDGVNTGWKLRFGPGAFLGANIGERFNLQASYYVVPSLGGFGLSGFNLSAHVQLF